jgi:hypothetical protein
MNFKAIALALALGAGSSAMAATCTSASSLGSLDASDFALFGNSFYNAQSFNDCYSFALTAPSDTLGITVEWDWSHAMDIDLQSVTLSGGTLVSSITDPTPDLFSFSNLQSGLYQLAVAGNVTRSYDSGMGVSYLGMLTTKSPSIAAPVPEPETLAMLALGLAAVTWSARRRR